MTPCARRFLASATDLVDRDTGLAWDPAPVAHPAPWIDATRAAAGRGKRLPTALELLTLLVGLPADFAAGPSAGDVLWSSSDSPYAPPSRVRAIACDGPGRFVLVLLDRAERARWWGVGERR
jgi:hypothetical protein